MPEPGRLVSQPPLSEQLRTARQTAGLSISELARRSGTSRAAIHAYEAGTVSPSLDTAQRILAAMGHTLTIRVVTSHDQPHTSATHPNDNPTSQRHQAQG